VHQVGKQNYRFVPVLQRIVCSLIEFYFRQDGAKGLHTNTRLMIWSF